MERLYTCARHLQQLTNLYSHMLILNDIWLTNYGHVLFKDKGFCWSGAGFSCTQYGRQIASAVAMQ